MKYLRYLCVRVYELVYQHDNDSQGQPDSQGTIFRENKSPAPGGTVPQSPDVNIRELM